MQKRLKISHVCRLHPGINGIARAKEIGLSRIPCSFQEIQVQTLPPTTMVLKGVEKNIRVTLLFMCSFKDKNYLHRYCQNLSGLQVVNTLMTCYIKNKNHRLKIT